MVNQRGIVIQHGGCLGCIQQEKNNLDFCDGCQYRKANWSLPDLSSSDMGNTKGRSLKQIRKKKLQKITKSKSFLERFLS